MPLVDACALKLARRAKLAGSETRRDRILGGWSKTLVLFLYFTTMLKFGEEIQIEITLVGVDKEHEVGYLGTKKVMRRIKDEVGETLEAERRDDGYGCINLRCNFLREYLYALRSFSL